MPTLHRRPAAVSSASDAGMATAELALALVALSVVAQFLLVAGTLAAAQLQASDAARISVRLAARGESGTTISRAVREVAPGARVDISTTEGVVRSMVRVSPPGRLAKAFVHEVTATARSVDETAIGSDVAP
jgi:hypothetical protein